ncbi:MAG: ATP-binding protein [Rhodospirillales bacterium]|nr:hypothetical protein [Rhodospirillaceae bacterium]MDP6428856.1 ATP-binding protein [Rhodospirillales bacterium]MDP6643953.1 ATP-binding protein [Rhodospirillales bacterium]MDP6841080.1 ATP-binding protein [Rhodospirillales bacterium]
MFKPLSIKATGWLFAGFIAAAGIAFGITSQIIEGNIEKVSGAWESFDQVHSDKLRLLNALHRELGYGGMIHAYKNYILRGGEGYAKIAHNKLHGAEVIIAQYEDLRLDETEKSATGDIRAMIAAYRRSMDEIAMHVGQGMPSAEINALVRIDDGPALAGFENLFNAEKEHFSRHNKGVNRRQILETLRATLGYGGMIHNFKDHVLTGDASLLAKSKAQIEKAARLLDDYRARAVSPTEVAALADIGGVLENYNTSLRRAAELTGSGLAPREIDAQIVVDDRPAVAGLIQLGRQIAADKETRAHELGGALGEIKWISDVTGSFQPFVPMIMIAMFLWLVLGRIFRPMKLLTDALQRMAAGVTDIDVSKFPRSGEFGDMACAIDTFRRTELEREKAEAALIESDARFHDFASAAADRFWETDVSHNVIYCSPPIGRMWMPMDGFLGRPMWDIPMGNDEDIDWRGLKEIMNAKKSFRSYEFTRKMPDGSPLHVSYSGVALFGDDGRFKGYRCTVADITDEVEAREQGASVGRRFVDALDKINAGVVLWDADRRLVMCNRFYKDIQKETSVLLKPGIHFSDYVAALSKTVHAGSSEDNIDEWIDDTIAHGLEGGAQGEYRIDGNRWIGFNRQKLSDGATISFHYEITDLKNHERELEDAMLKAEAANRAKSEFLANMSHELRTPLNAVIGYSDTLLENVFGSLGNEKQTEYVGSINRAGKHLLDVINEILDLSSVEAGAAELRPEIFKLMDVAAESVDFVEAQASRKGVKLNNRILDMPCSLNADRLRIRQILVNLLTNAVKFTDCGGTVSLQSHIDDENSLVLSIEDSGIGMTDEHIEIAMTKFGQVSNAFDRENEGTGLGLPLTRGLIDLHGGSLNIISQLGVGTTVEVRLPPGRYAGAAAA